MKTTMKKALVFALAFAMLLTCAAPAFAATAENVYQYGKEGGYLAIGDSIGRGCGAEGFYINQEEYEGGQYDMYFLRNVEGAYPYLVAKAVGCECPEDMTDQNATYWPLCYPGMTLAMTLDILGIDDGFSDEELRYSYYSDMLQYFGWEGSFDGVKGETYVEGECGTCGNPVELAKKADLITVEVGMCDIFYRAYRIISNGGMLADGLQFDLSSPEAIINLVKEAIRLMYEGFDYWKNNYPLLIKNLREWNPDAQILMLGSFNMLSDLTITDDLIAPIGTVITTITAAMNAKYREWEKEYNVKFIDISNTESLSTESGWSLLGDFKDNTFVGTHPSQKGYDYITRQILAALPEYDESINLKVDLGRFDTVDYVFVNGIPVKNYTLDGFLLSIPYSGILANNLTIGVKNADGTVSAQTYQLVYKIGEGYTAYRIYGNNDVEGTAKKPWQTIINLIKSLFEKIADAFRGLFNRG